MPRLKKIARDSEFTAVVDRLGVLRGIGTLTGVRAGRRDRRLDEADRLNDRILRRPGAHRVLLRCRTSPGRGDKDQQRARAPSTDRSRFAPPSPVPEVQGSASPIQPGTGGSTSTWRRGHQEAASAVVALPCREKNSNTANAAIARELAGWCWSLAVMDM